MNRNRHWSQIPLLAAECWSLRAPEAKNTSTTAPICSPGAQRARVRAFRRRARAQCDRCPRAPLIRFSTAAAHATRMVYEPAGARARSSRQGSDSVFLTALKHPDITDRDRTTHRHSTRSLRATRRPATHAATRDTARRLTLAPAGAPTPHTDTRRAVLDQRDPGSQDSRAAVSDASDQRCAQASRPHQPRSQYSQSYSLRFATITPRNHAKAQRPAPLRRTWVLWTRTPSAGRSGSR